MKIDFERKLFLQQARTTVIVAFLLGLIFSCIQLYFDYQNEERFIDKTINEILITAESAANQAVYNLDVDTASQILKGILKYDPIVKGEIVDEFNDIIAKEEKPYLEENWNRVIAIIMKRFKSYTVIFKREQKDHIIRSSKVWYLGHLSVKVDIHSITKNFFNRAAMVIFSGFLRNFILSIVLMILYYYSLTKPLTKIINTFSQVSPDSDNTLDFSVPKQHKSDELGILVQTFKQVLVKYKENLDFRINTEKKMNRLQEYLKKIIDAMPSILISIDSNSRITQWNPEAENATGISTEEAKDKFLLDVFPQFNEMMEDVKDAIEHQEILRLTKTLWKIKGGSHYVDILVYPLKAEGIEGAVIRVDDISDRVRMEQTMMQTEKMMSVGGLAAGMAHEINNPLGVILQGVQNIKRRFSPDFKKNIQAAQQCSIDLKNLNSYLERREINNFIEGISESGKRASSIIENMLQFSRKSDQKKRLVNLVELIERSIDLASKDYDLKKEYDFRNINLIREYGDNEQMLNCSETEIKQVVLNLLKNAAHAVYYKKNTGKSRIIIRTSLDKNMVRIEVEDNGYGIDEEIQKRIFEPFFTTKPEGIGTGLGLSVSYMICTNNHNGTLEVKSRPGEGTTFIIRLPNDNE